MTFSFMPTSINAILFLLHIVNNWIHINCSLVLCLEVTILVKVDKDDLTARRNADISQIWHSITLPSVRFFLRPFMTGLRVLANC